MLATFLALPIDQTMPKQLKKKKHTPDTAIQISNVIYTIKCTLKDAFTPIAGQSLF